MFQPAASPEHQHMVNVRIHLECGHTRAYTLPMQTVARNPDYARPGTPWGCQPCGAGTGCAPRRTVTAAQIDYLTCGACLPAVIEPVDPAAALPDFQPYHGAHQH